MSSTSSKMVRVSLILGACAIFCFAIVAQAQYNTFDSDSNSDSDGNPILTNAELGKLVRNSAKSQANQNQHLHRQQQQHATATRNLYNRQQPMQYAPTQNRHNYGSESLNGYGPMMGASSGRGSNANSDADDDESGASFGPNFGSNFDGGNEGDGEGSSANGDSPPTNLNQAASGYPGSQGDYNNDAAGAGFGFGGSSGYGPSEGLDFGPAEGFGGEGRRAKSASSLSGMRNFGSDDDAGAPQYGPNSAVNSGDADDEGRAGYSPEGQSDNDNDDE